MAERALATAFVNIVPGTKDLESYLKGKLGTQVGAAGVGAGGAMATGTASGFGAKIKGAFGPVLASMGAAFTVVGVVNFAKDMYQSAVAGQKVDAVLAQVTDSMGLFGDEQGKVVSRLQDYATEMMKRTGIDDDVIKSTQAQLMSFKDLASSADETGGMFDRATSIAADMAAVFGGDASGNAVKLGKALNDPVGGISSLSRVGVQFTEDQKAMITGMVEAGDVAGAQELIMKELETQVGGTAEASATAGEKMAARWDDAVQSLGTTLMPVFDAVTAYIADNLVPAFETAADNVKLFLGWFGDNQAWLIPVISGVAGALAGLAVYTTALGVAAAIAAAGGLPAIITATWLWTAALLANPITWIILGIGLLIGALVFLAMNWEAVTAWVSEVWGQFTTWLSSSLSGIAKGWNDFWTGIGQFVQKTWNGIVSWFTNGLSSFGNNWSKFWGTVGQVISTVWGNITKGIQTAWTSIVNWFGGAFSSFGKFFDSFWKGLVDGVGKVFGGIVNFVKAPMNAIIDAINSAIKIINNMKIKVPDWVPGIGGQNWGFNIPTIPRLADGGFVTGPTMALIGEAGPEVVTPLKDFERMMGMNDRSGNTIVYNAAPNASLDSEMELLKAMRRAKLVAGW
jgi:hypothetical protein